MRDWLSRAGSWSAAAAVAGLFVFFALKSRHEERLLAASYPRYGDYQRRVAKRLIPFLF